MTSSGYLHPKYAQSFDEIGEPIELSASKGWIIKRPVLGTSEFDGMGCYPIFSCQNWSGLENDLNQISSQLVSLSLVTDPFGGYNQQDLLKCFRDVAIPYKEHFIIDLKQRPEQFVATYHKRNVVKALKTVNVEICIEPLKYLNEWVSLYAYLIERHQITGLTKFSRGMFAKQLSIPGVVAFRATVDNKTVGMLLWYVQGDRAYYHLGAYSPDGYQVNASFALFWTLIAYFADIGLQWLSLGAGAGVQVNANDGLTRFKRGWSTGVRTAYFCGRIFDPEMYQKLVEVRNIQPTKFFPAYRSGE